MKQSVYFLNTLREPPSEAEIPSHRLMLRAGLIRQLVSGVYSYLPIGLKVLQKVQQIVREEMNRTGAQELMMPAVQPAELWQETGRWEAYGPELMRLKDRHDRDFVLGPTHEEVITSLVRDGINTYKRLPVNLYQIQTKYRDEVRPRFGVMRAREFVMKDAYSFDIDEQGLDESYRTMYEAYERIFTRCGLDFRAVEADSGAIGGSKNHEFMVLSEIGEDTIVHCEACRYAANIEKAEVTYRPQQRQQRVGDAIERVHTPGMKSVQEVVTHLQVDAKQIIKSILYQVDERYVLALVRGDREVNEAKLKSHLQANVVELADGQAVEAITGAEVGFAGPVDLKGEVTIVADHEIQDIVDGVAGANERDYHLLNVNPGIDFQVDDYTDLRMIQEDDRCPKCEGVIHFDRGIEVGHVFKLGSKYSEAMQATFLDQNGKSQPMLMGCYGIGISRTVAAAIEQNHDERGIVWPKPLAPFHVHLISVNVKKEDQHLLAVRIYETLTNEGWEVLYDDRNERAGVKFNDSDLLGIPLRIVVGGKAAERIVECKDRKTGESEDVLCDELSDFVRGFYA